MMVLDLEKEWRIPAVEEASVLTPEDYLLLEPLVDQVAATEWKGSHVFEMEDLSQAVWMHVVDKWEAYAGKDKELQFTMMRRFARGWCKEQRVEYMYTTGAYVYTPREIRARLEDSAFTPLDRAYDIDSRVDILREYGKLSRGRRAALYKQYALGERLTTGAERVAASEAVDTICTALNLGVAKVAQPLEYLDD